MINSVDINTAYELNVLFNLLDENDFSYSKEEIYDSISKRKMTKLKGITCPEGFVWSPVLRDVVYKGHFCGCPFHRKKNVSAGEVITAYIFKKYNVKFIPQKTFDWCVNPVTNRNMYFDFEMENGDLLELQGTQHFENRNKNRDMFNSEVQKIRDEHKLRLSKENNKNVIYIAIEQDWRRWRVERKCELIKKLEKYLKIRIKFTEEDKKNVANLLSSGVFKYKVFDVTTGKCTFETNAKEDIIGSKHGISGTGKKGSIFFNHKKIVVTVGEYDENEFKRILAELRKKKRLKKKKEKLKEERRNLFYVIKRFDEEDLLFKSKTELNKFLDTSGGFSRDINRGIIPSFVKEIYEKDKLIYDYKVHNKRSIFIFDKNGNIIEHGLINDISEKYYKDRAKLTTDMRKDIFVDNFLHGRKVGSVIYKGRELNILRNYYEIYFEDEIKCFTSQKKAAKFIGINKHIIEISCTSGRLSDILKKKYKIKKIIDNKKNIEIT